MIQLSPAESITPLTMIRYLVWTQAGLFASSATYLTTQDMDNYYVEQLGLCIPFSIYCIFFVTFLQCVREASFIIVDKSLFLTKTSDWESPVLIWIQIPDPIKISSTLELPLNPRRSRRLFIPNSHVRSTDRTLGFPVSWYQKLRASWYRNTQIRNEYL